MLWVRWHDSYSDKESTDPILHCIMREEQPVMKSLSFYRGTFDYELSTCSICIGEIMALEGIYTGIYLAVWLRVLHNYVL